MPRMQEYSLVDFLSCFVCSGKIVFYTHPPEQHSLPTHLSADIVSEWSKEFDLVSEPRLENLKSSSGSSISSSRRSRWRSSRSRRSGGGVVVGGVAVVGVVVAVGAYPLFPLLWLK